MDKAKTSGQIDSLKRSILDYDNADFAGPCSECRFVNISPLKEKKFDKCTAVSNEEMFSIYEASLIPYVQLFREYTCKGQMFERKASRLTIWQRIISYIWS